MKIQPLSSLFGNRFGRPVELNLGWMARLYFDEGRALPLTPVIGRNPLTDPIFCQAWVEHLTRSQTQVVDAQYSYGGYLEDRTEMWRGTYLEQAMKPPFIHLGVDINVRPMTEVFCPVGGEVVQRLDDKDLNGGWGGACVIRTTQKKYVIFAHLDLDDKIQPGRAWDDGDGLSSNRAPTFIGYVAGTSRNGGWYPHLHLQGMTHRTDLRKIDGYGKTEDAKKFPNPLKLLGLALDSSV